MSNELTPTHLIKGHFDGSIVVLQEPAPVTHAVEVTIAFPEIAERSASLRSRSFHWASEASPHADRNNNATDELIRQRRQS